MRAARRTRPDGRGNPLKPDAQSRPRVQQICVILVSVKNRPTSNQLSRPPARPVEVWPLNESEMQLLVCFWMCPLLRRAQGGATGEESLLPLESGGVNGGCSLVTQG